MYSNSECMTKQDFLMIVVIVLPLNENQNCIAISFIILEQSRVSQPSWASTLHCDLYQPRLD